MKDFNASGIRKETRRQIGVSQMNVKKYMKIISLALAFCLVLWCGFAVAGYVINRETDTSDEELGLSKLKGKRVNVLLMATDEGGQRTDTTVSYTHLDVYKRQAMRLLWYCRRILSFPEPSKKICAGEMRARPMRR